MRVAAAIVFKNAIGELQWLVVHEFFVERAKQGLRMTGTPAIAVIRPKRPRIEEYDYD